MMTTDYHSKRKAKDRAQLRYLKDFPNTRLMIVLKLPF